MDVANVESHGPANRRSQRVAAAGAQKKMESDEVEGAALDAIVIVGRLDVKEDGFGGELRRAAGCAVGCT